jgi:hypothetical protein
LQGDLLAEFDRIEQEHDNIITRLCLLLQVFVNKHSCPHGKFEIAQVDNGIKLDYMTQYDETIKGSMDVSHADKFVWEHDEFC